MDTLTTEQKAAAFDQLASLFAPAVAALIKPAPQQADTVQLVPLTSIEKETGRSHEWFIGRPDRNIEGMLNHYRDELDGKVVQYPTSSRGRYYVNHDRMIDWLKVHGTERH